jgi:hypothetical protein
MRTLHRFNHLEEADFVLDDVVSDVVEQDLNCFEEAAV